VTDQTVLPVAQQLLACLCEALSTNPNPPAQCCLRVGDVVYADFNQYQDQCCDGLAYVRVVRIYPTSEFPSQTEVWTPCAHTSIAVELEMGVFRCEPQQLERVDLPSCDEWTAVATQVADDSQAMMSAACCLDQQLMVTSPGTPVLMSVWQPMNSGGGCTGGTLSVFVGLMNCAC
jgi:hypothetical protein